MYLRMAIERIVIKNDLCINSHQRTFLGKCQRIYFH